MSGRRSFSWVALGALPVCSLILACGTPKAGASATRAPKAQGPNPSGPDGGVTESASPSGAPFDDLPSMATMPRDGVAGSKLAKVRYDQAQVSCLKRVFPPGLAAADRAMQLAHGCIPEAKLHAPVASFEGRQAAAAPADEKHVKVDANSCYRVYFTTDPSIMTAVAILRDSRGDVIATSRTNAVPEDGIVCFDRADEVTLILGVGAGAGRYAAAVFRQ